MPVEEIRTEKAEPHRKETAKRKKVKKMMYESIRKAYEEFWAMYDRQPEFIYMSESAYEKLKDETGSYYEPPVPHTATIFGARISLLDVGDDVAIFGVLAVGAPVIS